MESRVAPSQIPFQSKRYEWLEYFGGNMADVYLARETRTERVVIVKILKTEYCSETELQVRFAQEARLACQCQHPNIVTTYYADEEDGRPYIAMEHLQGKTIRELIKGGGIETQEQVFWIGLQLALALGYLQAAQIVHRDLKPDNVVVDQNNCAKLLDFGVARLKDSRLTEFGVRIGTLKYMSPEQVKSEPLTFSSDMYAFGVLMFEMLTFQLPYQAEGLEEFFKAILETEPNLTLLEQTSVPAEVIGVIKRCLQKEPANRYAGFAEIAQVLRPLVLPERLEHVPTTSTNLAPALAPVEEPRKSSKWTLIWAGLAIAIVAVLIGIWFVAKRAPATSAPPAAFDANTHKPSTEGMVRVDAGVALLGEAAKPVAVEGFYIDATEVTNAAYLAFCKATGCTAPDSAQQGPADYPVVNVSFSDAMAFAKWARKRLPTADEWEKAARGAQGQKFPWGNEWHASDANIPPDRAMAKTATLKSANSFRSGASPSGALNMLGNAWEWVNTAAAPDDRQFAVLSKHFSPPLSRTEPFYQTRGGSFRYVVPPGAEPDLVFDNRAMPARTAQDDLGFRCAKDR